MMCPRGSAQIPSFGHHLHVPRQGDASSCPDLQAGCHGRDATVAPANAYLDGDLLISGHGVGRFFYQRVTRMRRK